MSLSKLPAGLKYSGNVCPKCHSNLFLVGTSEVCGNCENEKAKNQADKKRRDHYSNGDPLAAYNAEKARKKKEAQERKQQRDGKSSAYRD